MPLDRGRGRREWTTTLGPALRRTLEPRWVRGGTCFFVGAAEDAPAARDVIAQLNGPARDLTGKTSLPARRRTLAL